MSDAILIKEFGHFVRDQIAVIGYRNQGDFLAGLGLYLRGGGSRLRGRRSWCVAHNTNSIHEPLVVKDYSNASNDERSENGILQAVQVTKYTASRTDIVMRKSRLTPRC